MMSLSELVCEDTPTHCSHCHRLDSCWPVDVDPSGWTNVVRLGTESRGCQALLRLHQSKRVETGAELFAPDVQHHLGNWQTGTEAIVRGRKVPTNNLEDIYRTFPDWKMETVQMVAEGESVVVRCRVSGTHQGVAARSINGGFLVGVQPTGKHFVVQHIHWFTVRNGQIAEHATSRDDLGMTQQLGLLPTRR